MQWLIGRYYHHNHGAGGPMGNPYRGQGRVLKLLKMQPTISQKDLSELLDMRPQSLGELLAKLERSGYITRAPLESDKRVMMVTLTEKGATAGDWEEKRPAFDDVLGCLSPEEQDRLREYLGRIIGELEKQFGGEESFPKGRWHGHKYGHGEHFHRHK